MITDIRRFRGMWNSESAPKCGSRAVVMVLLGLTKRSRFLLLVC